MTVVEERKNGRERYEEISNVGELAKRFQELGIEVLDRPRWREGGWGEILKWTNFKYGLTTGSIKTTIRREDEGLIEGMFSKGGDDNIFQFSIDGGVLVSLRGVQSITFGCSFDEELGQCLLLKGGTRLGDPVIVYIHETAKVRVIPE